MSGWNLLRIISYLHLFDTKKHIPREHPKYYTLFKVREFQKNLDHHFNHLNTKMLLEPGWIPCMCIWVDGVKVWNHNKIGRLWYKRLRCDGQ